MKKILIITSSFDLTVDYIINKFKDKVLFYRFNTDKFGEYEIITGNYEGWIIKNKYWSLCENDIYSIYYRKPTFPDLKEYESKYHTMMCKEMLTLITGIVEVFEGKCLTKPSILRKAENKIIQMKVAKQIGFKLPKSCITNSIETARKFCSMNQNIVKPVSAGKVCEKNKIDIMQTNLVNNKLEISDIEMSPAYFQEFIKKDYEIRATVINEAFYGVSIESSNKVDWRKNNSKNIYKCVELPLDIKQKCHKMLNVFNLKFGAFDFIVSNGEYYFLEINPNGQWYWLEEELNLDISNNIYRFLVGE